METLIIGDVHSQARPLEKALEYAAQIPDCLVIFLGDLFDSRCNVSETVEVYGLVRTFQDGIGAVVLHSNHQDKLLRFYKGNPVDLVKTPELGRTIKEFDDANIDREEVKAWLERSPYGYIFKDSRLREYRAAHAYFPSWVGGESNEAMARPILHEDTNSKARGMMLYGKVDHTTGQRIRWWETDKTYPWTRVAGHYHCVHISDSSIVLDGSCGNEGGRLPVYRVEARQLVYF